MRCGTLECFSEAVAKSKESGQPLCIECALRLMKQWGPHEVKTLPGAKFPWDHPFDMVCEYCKTPINRYLVAATAGCPKCQKTIKNLRSGPPFKWDEVEVQYKEGL